MGEKRSAAEPPGGGQDGAGATGLGPDEEGSPTGSDGDGGSRRFGDGIKQGIGVLAAFKDALEETIQEARERGDLSSERAKEVMKEALQRAQTAAEGARERLDFATQAQLEALEQAVEVLSARVAELEARLGATGPEATKHEKDSG